MEIILAMKKYLSEEELIDFPGIEKLYLIMSPFIMLQNDGMNKLCSEFTSKSSFVPPSLSNLFLS